MAENVYEEIERNDNMNKNIIYKMVFEEIKDSIEWGIDCKEGNYSHYIDGVICLGQRMLKELDNTDRGVEGD